MMLYPKKQEPLTLEDFQNPGSEYRGAPFWAWNGKLDKQPCWIRSTCSSRWASADFTCTCAPVWTPPISAMSLWK